MAPKASTYSGATHSGARYSSARHPGTPNGAKQPTAPAGALVIAGADAAFRRRLLQSLEPESHCRRISEVAARPDLQRHVAALLPSVILFDLGPGPSASTLGTVSALSGLAKTIVLAEVDDEALAIQALKAGASGFCSRDTATPLIRKAVQLVEAGEIWVGRRVMLRLIEELAALRVPDVHDLPVGDRLTSREREVATLVTRGAGNKQIAHQLSISIKTVKAHLTNIFKKLGLATRLQLALALGRVPGSQTRVG
jgi:DNA-binding NarL/FixJ family response regulator